MRRLMITLQRPAELDAGVRSMARSPRKGAGNPRSSAQSSPGPVLLPVIHGHPAPPRRMPSGRQWGVAMRGLIRRAAVAFGAAAVLLGPAAGAAAGTSASVPGWSIAPSPNPVIPTGQLFGVSCPAANSCVAVGTYVRSSGAGVALAGRE